MTAPVPIAAPLVIAGPPPAGLDVTGWVLLGQRLSPDGEHIDVAFDTPAGPRVIRWPLEACTQ